LGAFGLLRFAIDAGQSLLVGSSSSAGQTYASFAGTFGSDPIVLVLTAKNPAAFYSERNLQRLGALEVDLSHDKRVASVLGPGTLAGSLREAAVAEVSKVLTQYPYFIAETDYLQQLRAGNTDQTKLQQQIQADLSNATALLVRAVVTAAGDAHTVRSQYATQPGDRIVDSREKAVDAAVAKDEEPPLWAQYLAGPNQQANAAAAQQFFARVAAAYGDCDDQIASLLKISASCQVFFQRTLLDLPNCPALSTNRYCTAKAQWAAVLPQPRNAAASHAIITVRLKPEFVGDQTAVSSLQDKINSQLAHGIADDAYTRSLPAAPRNTLKSIGKLGPTECGGATADQDPACTARYHDAKLAYVIAGAPLLGLGVVRSMTQLLAVLFPVALFVMLLLLAGTFRVRGRVWPLVAAVATTVLTVGISLLTGTPITPAVLAGVPVLIGLGVDYAVQLVARYSEERGRGATVEVALQRVLERTAHATLIAAVTTIAGLASLALLAGIDWGPLVAVPLVAEFALVLSGGVVLAWLGGLFIALPLAVWSEARQPAPSASAANTGTDAAGVGTRAAARTAAIAENWRAVVGFAGLLALAGWALLFLVPVQTDVQKLVSTSLPELRNVETVQRQTGYTNEIDVYLRGQVATGPTDPRSGAPVSVEWQCGVDAAMRAKHRDTVAEATSIGDYAFGAGSGSSASRCAPAAAPAAAPSPSPSPTPSAAPGATSSPSSSAGVSAITGGSSNSTLTAARVVGPVAAAATPSASATPAPSTPASPGASASASPSASPAPAPSSHAPAQTGFLCSLRLLPALSRTLVMPIGVNVGPCPPVDEYQQTFLSADATPIGPTAARIAIGVHTDTVAQQAALVDSLRAEIGKPPSGVRAEPTGLAVLATTAYNNLVERAYPLNLVPLAVVALVLFAVYREPRRVLLPLLPTALAAGWAPLLLLLLGRLPGGLGSTLGSFNPLTVVLGALIVALGTEFGVVLIGRFYEERARGLDPDAAAGAALNGVGRAIQVSAVTLGAGFAVLAISGLFPNSLPLVADFGLAVVIDLALAVGAVFLVMLPLAVALEKRYPLPVEAVTDVAPAARPEPALPPEPAPKKERVRRRATTAKPAEAKPAEAKPGPPPEATGDTARRMPGVSGRRRAPRDEETTPPATDGPRRLRPGVSGRKRRS
ncbi:MAG: hypothetical protein E6J45_07545, partial [Chloroflexi bacterium]